MFCRNCGSQIGETGRFCPKCGTPVVSHNAASRKNEKTKRRAWIVISICTVIFMAVIGIVFGVYRLSNSDNRTLRNSYSDKRDQDEEEETKENDHWGESKSSFVVHPDFKLSDGFIAKVERQRTTPDGYISVSTAEEFDKIRLNTAANYILMADIDLSEIAWEGIDKFTGILDGNGYIVSNASNALFKEADGATIQNLGVYSNLFECGCGIVNTAKNVVLDNCFFDGSITDDRPGYSVGGLIGTMYEGTVINCYNKGTLIGNGSTGGIIAYVNGSIFVSNCFNQGDVAGGNSETERSCYCGGIVGYSNYHMNGDIRYCYNSGNITCQTGYYFQYQGYNLHYGSAVACGIVGNASVGEQDWLYITMCYNSGTISGGDIGFGICVAYGTSAERTRVHNCYNRGEFTLYNSYGIAGCISGDGSFVRDIAIEGCYNVSTTGAAAISNNSKNLLCCYYLDEIENATYDGALFSAEAVQKLTKSEMSKKSSFDLDFEYVWRMGSQDYPYPVFGIGD